jgi:RsiW-degrading membrane proteinase PrsW (M82 family)
MRTALLVALAALVAWSLVELALTLATTPPVILAGAAAPASVFALAVAHLARTRKPPALLAAAFLWGAAVAPVVSLPLNDAARGWLGSGVGTARSDVLAPAVVGPLVEESAKAVALGILVLARRGALAGPIDGLVYGAMIGVGFTMTENVSYLTLAAVQGGAGGLARAVYTRGVLGGLNHAAFTATFGAALGAALRARSRARRGLLIGAGFAGALAQHALWNATASRAITALLCDPAVPGGACRVPPSARRLYVDIPLVVLACLGPGVAILALVWRDARRRPDGAAGSQS